MSAFKLIIRTDNAAFEHDKAGEIARILKGIILRIDMGEWKGTILDLDGHTVGDYITTR